MKTQYQTINPTRVINKITQYLEEMGQELSVRDLYDIGEIANSYDSPDAIAREISSLFECSYSDIFNEIK